MREIDAQEITSAVAALAVKANYELGEDVVLALKQARDIEVSQQGRGVLDKLILNAELAAHNRIPLCQDCGAAVLFLNIGQDLHITGGDLTRAVNDGVRQGYQQGYLRKSMISAPFSQRCNTGDNTPATIHTQIIPGDRLEINFMPKGGGAENMSRLVMLKPGEGDRGIVDAVVSTVRQAGGNPCPPLIIGMGIGSTTDGVFILAKKALLRRVGELNPDPEAAELEKRVLAAVNGLGIGPLGCGGRVTALAVQAEVAPCHFASLPLAVNLQCHSARHAGVIL
jgi:fumarate hydratase subunit alpha